MPSVRLPPPLFEEPLLHPLRELELVEALDRQMAIFPKRALKGAEHPEKILFPVRELSAEAQTLFYRLADLDRGLLTREPDRLLQAQVYVLALIGSECLNRIPTFMHPYPSPSEFPMPAVKVKNRHVAQAIAADLLVNSSLLERVIHPALRCTLTALPDILHANVRFLDELIRRRDPSQIDPHLTLRQDVFTWLRRLMSDATRPTRSFE